MAINALPTPPSRDDPANFSSRGDSFMSALPAFVTEANALQTDVNDKQATASTAATTATTQAGIATTQAGIATTQAGIATTQAGIATTQAGIATTQAALATSNGAAQVALAAAQAAAASTSATNASTSASTATTASASAVAARDLSIAAWASAAAPMENLAAFSQSIHSGTIVKAIIYDTSKDTDGGAWRQRCGWTSWMQETLGGTVWLGQAATAAAAWAMSGAATGYYFQNTTDKKFYQLGASSPSVTEVFRGNVAKFPEKVAIVAETQRVVIYDLTQPGVPMWMVFARTVATTANTNVITNTAGELVSSIAAFCGVLCIGQNPYDLVQIHFVKDAAYLNALSTISKTFSSNLAGRNSGVGYVTTGTIGIVNRTVNDVAITVLPGAPTDPATGLPVPTIYAFTAGGVSRISDTGTVSSTATNVAINFGSISGGFVVGGTTAGNPAIWPTNTALPAGGASDLGNYWGYSAHSTWSSTRLPRPLAADRSAANALAGSTGLMTMRRNPASRGSGMLAAITTTYNSGYQVGDSRGAWLADTTAETITAPELVTNGTFSADISGWTDSSSAGGAIAWNAAGSLNLVNTSGTAVASQAETTVVGKTYKLIVTKGGTTATIGVGTTATGTQLYAGATDANDVAVNFVATSTTTYINASRTTVGTGTVDNISIKLVDPDRSVKANGLSIIGTLTKTAVASGAGLVAYSGFSASNYLEQAFSANLDFSTTDFCVMGWANVSTPATAQTLLTRGTAGANTFAVGVSTNWIVTASATAVQTDTGVAATAGLHHVCLYRTGGNLYLYVDGRQIYTVANSVNLTNAAALLDIGVDVAHANPWLGSAALMRISATAPSADQIAAIYAAELPLFQAGAQCTIAGTSTAVNALSYDDETDLLHVGTSWGRTSFRDLLRIDSEATTVGAVTSVAAQGGTVVLGGTSAKVYQPAFQLRDEIQRKDVARKALGKEPVFFDYDAVTSQTAFVLPKGYTTKAVYSAGTLKRLGSTKDYVVSNDGFQETVTFAVAPGNTVWVSIMAVRT